MESKVNYTVVGLFVVLLGAALIALFLWLSNFKHDKVYQTYLVYVHEDVTGLSIQSPVRFNGVPVGVVKAIELDPRNPQLVRLNLSIEQGTPITTSTVATLQFQGITGVLYVGLKATTMDAPLLTAKAGEQYPVIPAKPSLLLQLSAVLPEITKNVKALGASITKVFDDKNRKAISESLQNISVFTKTLAENSKALNKSMRSLQKTLAKTEKASQQFPEVMMQMNKTLLQVRKTAVNIDDASKGVKSLMLDGRMAITNFATQVLPGAQQTLDNLTVLSSNLKQLTGEMQSNPSMLIRGKQPAPPGPGEK